MKITPYWIAGPWPGRLAIIPRPRGGDWLGDEAQAWRAVGLDVVVSMLTAEEADEMDLRREAEESRAAGLEFYALPTPDRGIPPLRAEADALLSLLGQRLAEGKNVGIHCRQGIGRAALIAGSLLILSGLDPETAFARVSAARGCPTPETTGQRQWAMTLARAERGAFAKQQKA